MLTVLKSLLGMGPKADLAQLYKSGAIILDVRTKGEYASGHLKGSINIPVDQLRNSLDKLKDRNKPIITCCASGMRSGTARNLLISCGYKEVYNGGGWMSLRNKL